MKQNLIIRASAGTGKTFSLATRFIRLMMLQKVKPERIVALTFSRAAAQEIYTKLLDRLWSAAMSEEGAAKEKSLLLQGMSAGELAVVEGRRLDWSARRFAEILHDVISTQYHGAIATLDSFILKIVRSFPLEMGFQNAVDVIDAFAEKRALDDSCNQLLTGKDEGNVFSKSFKTIVNGKFERTCADALGGWLKNWRDFMTAHPQCREWTPGSMKAALALNATMPNIDALPVTGKRHDPFEAIQIAARNYKGTGDMFPNGKGGELMRHLISHPDETSYTWTTDSGKEKTISCTQEEAEIIRGVVRCMVGRKLANAVDAAHAKLTISKLIEKEYNASTRSRGQLTFSDFTSYQAAAEEDSDRALNLENIQFRFDSRFDHWALDEFQDTSELQWTCLRRLVQEAAQPDPDRSVMAVGDLKQSIYTWRGGNDAPFKEMMDGWREFRGDVGEIVPNDVSYRYEKNTADFINMVFGPGNVRDGGVFGDEVSPAVERWLAEDCWMEHRPDVKNGVPKSGDYVEVVKVTEPDKDDDGESGDDPNEDGGSAAMRMLAPGICTLAAEMWAKHEAAHSTDTIGILVRNNNDGSALAERLRATSIPGTTRKLPVVWEGMDNICDAPVVRAVLELLRLSEHPQDTFAWRMTDTLFPVREAVFPALKTAEGVSKAVAGMLTQDGLARTLKEIAKRIVSSDAKPDERSVLKLESLVREAVNYERRRDASHGVVHFIQYLEMTSARDASSSSDVIRILTIHRSKGLTLDHVIVPILEKSSSKSIAEPRKDSLLALKDCDWVVSDIPKSTAMLHPQICKAWLWAANESVLESLRLNYVALTRARKSTHVFVCGDEGRPGNVLFRDVLLKPFENRGDSVEKSYGLVVAELGTMPQFGRKDSHEGNPASAWQHAPGRELVQRRSPADGNVVAGTGGGTGFSLGALFAHKGMSASDRGSGIHDRYAQIEWIDRGSPKDEEERLILGSSWAEAFTRSPDTVAVWRERAYEIFANGVWETGRFDRVVFAEAGGMKHATIYDFKTHSMRAGEGEDEFADRVCTASRNQMNEYRRALSAITGIPCGRISVKLLLSATRGMVEVACEGR